MPRNVQLPVPRVAVQPVAGLASALKFVRPENDAAVLT